ncbi:hypothetical protein GCM10011584_09560 [Nocardioides phosphati]|uniref:Uncharacterized protein n=1 Tax=Nocardioides phosphati TaxID=1867775 RepID=A0ABQ2N830_9ACTN|nr:hypothetical protein [Nocardioides phosphati]GGO86676.1 hypothetical protein GCM10011584_09560 [Nocardioides phosphati]
MSDPRILPDTTLDTYRADIKRANDNDLGHVWLWRAQELLGHIDGTSEQRDAQRKRADNYRDTENTLLRAETARADAAEQRLADRDKAIRDLTDKWRAEAGDDPRHGVVLRTAAAALRALLTEDGA